MATYKDPVCGMQVEERSALWQSRHHGETYFFCSKDCKEQFDQHPEKHLQEQVVTKPGT